MAAYIDAADVLVKTSSSFPRKVRDEGAANQPDLKPRGYGRSSGKGRPSDSRKSSKSR